MSLVSAKEIAKALNINKFGFFGNAIGWVILKILGISELNTVYDKIKHLNKLAFLEAMVKEFQIDFEIPEEDLKRIPKEGAFITVSNHPLGGIDGILLLKLLANTRPDFKILPNFILLKIAPIKDFVLSKNPFENGKSDCNSNRLNVKEALEHIKSGNPLGIFPAGEVSTYSKEMLIQDKPWDATAVKFIKRARVPVVPICFHAKNSTFFYILAKLSPMLKSAKLPSELLSQKRRTIKVRIGKAIPVKEQDNYVDFSKFSDFLRMKTYVLANPYKKGPLQIVTPTLKFPSQPKTIVSAVCTEHLVEEVENLQTSDAVLLTSKNYSVFLADSKQIPNILHEIGRLREITFRTIGEGTNKAIDIDAYDVYYKHMFLWDNDAQRVVGSYRMGLGDEIFKAKGVAGFYVNELFKFEPELHSMLSKTIEMGRAFIINEYQQKPMPLFLLWKGIVHVTLRYPKLKYLLGGVSISNKFSNFSKSLMIEFMKSNYYDPYVAQYVQPKKDYKVRLKDADKDFIFDVSKADMNKFDKIIDEIEPGSLRLPVLLKKYVKQNARLIAFNVDPKFNNAIDGLMYIRISDIPESTVKPVMEEFQAALEKKLNGDS
ncbi:MAG: lysophospholipid acyltransferase family protein [Flavobacteriaceae bacterium]|nr:lysophospholipid acyltransferase family protein [Flavobacteriaceae bacterium]